MTSEPSTRAQAYATSDTPTNDNSRRMSDWAKPALIEKGGVDRRAYLELLTSTVFDAPVYRTYGALIASAGTSMSRAAERT